MDIITWNVHHIYEGITVLVCPASIGVIGPQGLTYASMSARRIDTVNWRGVGISDSVAMYNTHRGDIYTGYSEPDKLVQEISWSECEFTPLGGIGFQSSSIDVVKFTNCKFDAPFGGIAPKAISFDGCLFSQIGFSGGTGLIAQ